MRFGIIGSGSWATALAKILTDTGHTINWWVRHERIVSHLKSRRHNPEYLSSVHFAEEQLQLYTSVDEAIRGSDCVVVAIPSAYALDTLTQAGRDSFKGRKVLSAIKGILPPDHLFLNEYLAAEYAVPPEDYCTVMGPCHAEEVASERLSYLTFSGFDTELAQKIASCFRTDYINVVINDDVVGVQFAAVLKNIYALGAGIAHGLQYGDNFQSVLIANCADEMAGFLQKAGIPHMEVGVHSTPDHRTSPNYAASVYLGDLLVTSYSLFSRNRTFGNMIGTGYSVSAAKLEMKMVAEGYSASRSLYTINKDRVGAEMPIADAIYRILWENVHPREGFRKIESVLI